MLKFIVICVFVTISTVHSNPLTITSSTESKVTATVAPLVTANEEHKKTPEVVANDAAPAAAVPEIKPADTIFNEQLVEGVVVDEIQPEVKPVRSSRQSRQRVTSLRDALQCGFDVACFLDVIEVVANERKQIMLADADARYITSNMARKQSNESPSELADTVEGIISKMTDIVKETVTGWFADEKDDGESSKETENSEEDEVAEEEENNNEEHKEVSEESRGKKKKKLKSLMKLLILGAVLKAKLTVLLQLLSAALQVKFFFIALTGLLINKIRLWYDLKKGHHPQKVIYYEHAQHQHHYDHLEDDHHGGGFWGRAYEVPEEGSEEHSQELAYRGQKSRRPIPWSPPQRGGYEQHYE